MSSEYRYTINTGRIVQDSLESADSLEPVFSKNTVASYERNAAYYDTQAITGRYSAFVSLNGQTLLEETPIEIQLTNKKEYTINTGDFYILPEVLEKNGTFIIDGINISNSEIVLYDKRDFSSGAVQLKLINTGWSGYMTNFAAYVHSLYANAANVNTLFQNYNIFINGQTLSTSTSYPDSSITGKVFAIPKSQYEQTIFSENPDYIGFYNESQVDLYVNGMEMTNESMLQIYSGLSDIIKSGVNCSIDLIEFNENQYQL